MSIEMIHKTLIPLSHALLWGIGMMGAIYGTEFYDLSTFSKETVYLYAAGLVYLIFLVEVALVFTDIGYCHHDKPFSGKVFKTVGLLFLNIALTVITGAIYAKNGNELFLVLMTGIMSWLKYKTVSISNNVEAYYKIIGRSYTPNKLNIK